MYNRTFWICASMMMLALSGCSHAPLAKDFNEANANNIAVQTVNPQAGKTNGALNTLDGEKSEKALDNYRQNSGRVSSETMLNNMKN